MLRIRTQGEADQLIGLDKPVKPQKINVAAESLTSQFLAFGLPHFVREQKFVPNRNFRADWYFPKYALLVELEGITPTTVFIKSKGKLLRRMILLGRHTEIQGFYRDLEKYNFATELGYSLIRVTPKLVDDPQHTALNWVIRALVSRGYRPHSQGTARP